MQYTIVCSTGIVNWTKDEKGILDRKTRKIITMHRALHPKANVIRLYMKERLEKKKLSTLLTVKMDNKDQ